MVLPAALAFAPFRSRRRNGETAFAAGQARARTGKEALQLYDPQTINLVLTNLFMPDMEGLELISELHQAHQSVRIIAMSGGGRNTPEEYLPIAQLLGAVRTLTKPFHQDELAKALRECLAAP